MSITSWYDGVSIGNRPNTAEWQETSGLAGPARIENADYIWAQSDGSIGKIFPIRLSDGGDAGAWTLTGASPVDIEDLASANVGGQPYIYLADTGNNGNSTNSRGSGIDLRVYRIKEPVITGSTGNLAAGTNYETISCAYPAGNTPSLRDCEVLLVDPDTGDMYFITKRFTPAAVYRLAHASSYSGTQTLEYLGTITTPPYSIGADNANGGYYVGGTISPDGTEILLKGYEDVYLFTRNKATQTIMQAMQGTANNVRAYVSGGYPTTSPPGEPKGEGICYDYYGEDFFTASEYLASAGHGAGNHPTYRYVRAVRAATEATFREGTNSYAGTSDTYVWSLAAQQSVTRGTEATFVVDYETPTDERVGLLKFDTSSIPAGSIVVGADLELYISVEGQQFRIYEMLQDWNEDSTYTSLGGLPAFDDVDASSAYIWNTTFGNYDTITGATALNTTGSSGSGTVGTIRIKLPTSMIQDWVDGVRPNRGWVIHGLTNADGLQFASSEAATEAQRPGLYIRYMAPLAEADEVDAVEYKPSTAYPAQSGERSAQRVPIDYISAGGISFADSRVMNMGRSGSVSKPIGAQVARGADTGVESISNSSAFPAEITALREQRLLPKGVVDKVHKFSSDVSPYLITSGWDWSSGQLNNILYAEMTGDNLITNGDFPANLDGWTYTQTLGIGGGVVEMPNDTYLYQSITVEANTNYRLSVDIVGEEVGLYVLDEDFVAVITSAHHGGGAALTHYIDFNSGDRTTLIIYIWSSSGGPNIIDNILVKRLRYGINTTFGVEANGVNFLSGGKNIGNRNLS